MKTILVNLKRGDKFDVYIGRGGIWGNPFVIGKDGDRNKVIDEYRKWLKNQPNLLDQLENLRGKRLGCFCHPLKCHGEVILELLGESGDLEQEQMF